MGYFMSVDVLASVVLSSFVPCYMQEYGIYSLSHDIHWYRYPVVEFKFTHLVIPVKSVYLSQRSQH